jgi:hypothetical protein
VVNFVVENSRHCEVLQLSHALQQHFCSIADTMHGLAKSLFTRSLERLDYDAIAVHLLHDLPSRR